MPNNQLSAERLADGGPIYHETNLDHFISEPWNASSSLFFLIPGIIFLIILYSQYKKHSFIIFWCAPLLFIGGTGSMIYHAFREYSFFLYLDFVPIAILTISVSVFFWIKIMPKWWQAIIIVLLSFILRGFVFKFSPFNHQTAINISYFITGAMIFIPALLYLINTKFSYAYWLILSGILLTIALYFRYYDDNPIQYFSAGTHWLWHLFSASGSFALGYYLIKIKTVDFKTIIQ